MQETWYVLEDGSVADPNEVSAGKDGKLRHKGGMAVAIGSHGNPKSRSIDPDEERAKAKKEPKTKNREMTAEDDGKAKYHTR